MEGRVDSLAKKLCALESTVDLFRQEFAFKMNIVEQLLSTKTDQLCARQKSLEQETSLYKCLLGSWTDNLLRVQSQPQQSQQLPTQFCRLAARTHLQQRSQLQPRSAQNCRLAAHLESHLQSQSSQPQQILQEILPPRSNSCAYQSNQKRSTTSASALPPEHQTQLLQQQSSSIRIPNQSSSGNHNSLSSSAMNNVNEEQRIGLIPEGQGVYSIAQDPAGFDPEEVETDQAGLTSNLNEEIIAISDEDATSRTSFIGIKIEDTTYDDVEIISNEPEPEANFSQTTSEFSLKCQTCGSTEITQASLRTHMIRMHGGNGGLICYYCGTTFSQLGSLNQHKQIHLEGKSLQCSLCTDTEFAQLDRLVCHMKNQHGIEQQTCKLCDKEFAGPTYLKRHMCIFHNQEKLRGAKRNKKCSLCPKRYQTRADLLVHIRSHTGEKPYHCLGCQKHFADTRNLRRHLVRFPDCQNPSLHSQTNFVDNSTSEFS